MANNFDSGDFTGSFSTDDINQNQALAIIAYIPLLFLVPLFAAGHSKYAKFHANQGLILTIFFFICAIVTKLVEFIIGWIPFIGHIISTVFTSVLGIAVLTLCIIGIVNAAQKKAKKLPFIGDFIDINK